MIKIKNLTKTYKSGNTIISALDNLNLELPNKGLVFILGESGSGKSTLLNILGCLNNFDSGYVSIDDYNISNLSDSKKRDFRANNISFIFQDLNLINEVNVYENIKISLDLLGINDKEKIIEVSKYLEIEDLLDKKVTLLSGGERQRVAIARSLVKKPKLVLADEPTGALDNLNSENIMKLLKKISKDTLVVVVTHNEELANKYASRIIKLSDGKIIYDNKKKKNKNEEIISNRVIKISKDIKEETFNELNKRITSYNKDIYLSFESNKKLNYALFKEDIDNGLTNKEDINYSKSMNKEEINKTNFALKNILKISFYNLLKRLKFVILTIVLISLSFILYITSDGLSNFNKHDAYIETIEKEDLKSINLVYFDNDTNYKRINDDIYNKISEYGNINHNKQYLLNYKLLLNKAVNGSKYLEITGISEISDFNKYGYSFKEGNGNFTSLKEIVIEESFATYLLEGEYFKDSVIGKNLIIHDNEYKIIGVLEDNSLLKDSKNNSDIISRVIFVKEGFMEEFYNDITTLKDNYLINTSNKDYYASIIYQDYRYNSYLSYYYDEGESRVEGNKILVSENIYNELDKKEIDASIANLDTVIYKGKFKVIGYYTYNNIEGIDNANISNLYNNSILISTDYKKEMLSNLYYPYQVLSSLSDDDSYNREYLLKVTSLGLSISNDFIKKYDNYIENIEQVADYLNIISIIFLVISLFFILSYVKNNIDENSKVIGTLNALGFKKGSIIAMTLFEHIIIVLIGLIVSIMLSIALIPLINSFISASIGFYFSSYIIKFDSLITIILLSLVMLVISIGYSYIKSNKESINLIKSRE